jgi:hypothetical protein
MHARFVGSSVALANSPGLPGRFAAITQTSGRLNPGVSTRGHALRLLDPRPAYAVTGVTTIPACSVVPSGSSAPDTGRAWRRSGYRPSTASTRSCGVARRSPTSGAVMARRSSSWPMSTQSQSSGASTSTPRRSRPHGNGRPKRACRSKRRSRSHRQRTTTAQVRPHLLLRLLARHGRPDRYRRVRMYTASSAICTPNSLSQEVGLGLGAQAGPGLLREVVRDAGLTRFRVAAETPMNLVMEARP